MSDVLNALSDSFFINVGHIVTSDENHRNEELVPCRKSETLEQCPIPRQVFIYMYNGG